MRQITRLSSKALRNHEYFKRDNMRVTNCRCNYTECFLHHNLIARNRDGFLTLWDCGWQTTTTKERLNGILETFNLPYRIYQKDFVWYIWNYKTEEEVEWHSGRTFTL